MNGSFPIKSSILMGLFFLTACHRSSNEEPLVAIQIQDRNNLTETISSPDRLAAYAPIDFLTSQPYKKILRVYKKNGKSHSKITTYHPNGQLWQYLEAEELRAHGAYREWFSNGQLHIDATVIGGTADVAPGTQHDWLFDGVSQVWNEAGDLAASIPYRQGELEGLSVYYYPSGQIQRELPYRKSLLEGTALEYYPSGKIRSKVFYSQGAKQGESIGYFENGQTSWLEQFRDGLVLQGDYYDIDGKPIAEVRDGMGFQALFNGNTLTHLIQIFQGVAEGGVKQFNAAGDVIGIFHIKNAMKQGEEIGYYSLKDRRDGKTEPLPKLSIQWDRDIVHGMVKTWYENGQLESQREYARNKKNGTAVSWFRDGSLMSIEEYEDDRLVKGQYYKRNAKEPTSTILNGNGIATLYDENGIFLKKITYAKGEPIDPER